MESANFKSKLESARQAFASQRSVRPKRTRPEILLGTDECDSGQLWDELSAALIERFGDDEILLHPDWTEGDVCGGLYGDLVHQESGLHFGSVRLDRWNRPMDDFQFYAFISAFSSFGAKGIGQGVQLLEEQLLRGIPILESKRDWSPEYV